MDLENTIKQFITDEILQGNQQVDITFDDPLVDSGIVDSLALVRLIIFLESMGYSLKPHEIVPENFQTINKMCTLLRQKD